MRISNWGLVFAIACCSSLAGQQNFPTPPTAAAKTNQPTADKIRKPDSPQLTPQQRQGVRLLKTAEAMAAGLQPDMHAYVLWQVSRGYQKVNRPKAAQLLQQAFDASRSIEDSGQSARTAEGQCQMEQVCAIQQWVQREILSEMLSPAKGEWNPEAVEKLLPQANEIVNRFMLEELAAAYAEKKNFGRARELLDRFDADEYPFNIASDLMALLPSSPADDRIALFSQALARFQDRNVEQSDPDEGDFGVMLVRFWHGLPSGLVLQAIDSLLGRAKEVDQNHQNGSVSLTLMSGESLNFGSQYEFRVFELLPILQALDKAKAESLLREHQQARSALDRYPKGFESFDPEYYSGKRWNWDKEAPLPNMAQVMAATDDDPAENAQLQTMMQEQAMVQSKIQKISQEAAAHPEQAYTDALNLPLKLSAGPSCPRATGLRRFALAAVKTDPTLAKAAMAEARRLAQDVEPTRQSMILADVPEFYLKLGDEQGARDAIKDQVKLAEKLYQTDSDSNDPNLAFKGAWPSANTWGNCVQIATKLSPAFAEEIITEIPDPEIEGFERVQYANSLLSAGETSIAVVQWHKEGQRTAIYVRR
jgi:hypothetical protein